MRKHPRQMFRHFVLDTQLKVLEGLMNDPKITISEQEEKEQESQFTWDEASVLL